MVAFRYNVRRRYSAMTLPMMRGFVFCATSTDDEDEPNGIAINRYEIHGICVCATSRWRKHEPDRDRTFTEYRPLSDQQLEEEGFVPEWEESTIVPVILIDPSQGEPHELDANENLKLAILTETEEYHDPHEVIWCTWESTEDEQQLEAVVRRLKQRFRRRMSQ